MKIAADICQRLALIKEKAMSTWAEELGAEAAIAQWQQMVRDIPRDTPYDKLPESWKQEINKWE